LQLCGREHFHTRDFVESPQVTFTTLGPEKKRNELTIHSLGESDRSKAAASQTRTRDEATEELFEHEIHQQGKTCSGAPNVSSKTGAPWKGQTTKTTRGLGGTTENLAVKIQC